RTDADERPTARLAGNVAASQHTAPSNQLPRALLRALDLVPADLAVAVRVETLEQRVLCFDELRLRDAAVAIRLEPTQRIVRIRHPAPSDPAAEHAATDARDVAANVAELLNLVSGHEAVAVRVRALECVAPRGAELFGVEDAVAVCVDSLEEGARFACVRMRGAGREQRGSEQQHERA